MALDTPDAWRRALFETSLDGVAILNEAGRCVDANPALCHILGAPREALVGARFDDFLVVVGDAGKFSKMEGDAFAGELALRVGAGPVVTVDWRARSNAVPGHRIWVGRDVTERRRREQAAERHREWLRTTLASIGDAVIATDASGRVTLMNAVAEELTGWSEAEALSRPLLDVFPIVHEKTRQPAANPVEHALRSGKIVGLANHTMLLSRDGREIAIDDSAAPIVDEDDEVQGVVLIFRDIGDRRRLAEAAERLAAIVESSDDAIVSKDLDGVVRSWNRGAERIFGYGADEIIGRPIAILVPQDRPNEEPEILARLRRGERVDHFETVRVRKDGRRIDVSVTISPIKNTEGEIVGASKVAREIGREKVLRDELQQRVAELAVADARKDEFLAMLAHELRNPLGAISNAVFLLQESDDEATRARAQQVLQRQVQYQARIVNELLDVSRISRGLIELHFEELDAVRLLREAAEDYRPAIEVERIELQLQVPQHPVWVRADRTRLAQVITNVISNALKFTRPGGRVIVGANEEGEESLAITVEDTGIGIDADLLPHVFESFTHGDRSLARTHGGLGLGLAIVKGLVELHHGTIDIESAGVGKGTRVRIALPVVARSAVAARRDAVERGRGSLRVLIVEDNRDAAEMLQDLLSLQGHEVAVAFTGVEGVRMAREHHPDLILCDLGLPGMDGFEVAEALRMAPGGAQQRLVAVTGYGQDEDRRKTREAGFQDHLVKPIDPDELDRILSGLAAELGA
jgi:PAS domain S-box-containing protein